MLDLDQHPGAPVAPLEVLRMDASLALFGWRRLCILVPRSGKGDYDVIREDMEAFRSRSGGRFGLCTLILPGTQPPAPEEKKKIDEHMEHFEEVVDAACVLIRGQGFFASIFLSVGSKAIALASKYPMKLTTSNEDAAKHFSKHMPDVEVAACETILGRAADQAKSGAQ